MSELESDRQKMVEEGITQEASEEDEDDGDDDDPDEDLDI
jgi:hypothetical protein